jgi:hypothetical protein
MFPGFLLPKNDKEANGEKTLPDLLEKSSLGEIGSKGGPGEECARTICKNRPAIGYNRSTGRWYCRDCSDILNKENEVEAKRIYGGKLVIIST